MVRSRASMSVGRVGTAPVDQALNWRPPTVMVPSALSVRIWLLLRSSVNDWAINERMSCILYLSNQTFFFIFLAVTGAGAPVPHAWAVTGNLRKTCDSSVIGIIDSSFCVINHTSGYCTKCPSIIVC